MRGAWRTVLSLVVSILLAAPAASGASLDCSSRWLTRAETTICADPQLARMDEQLARRLDSFAPRLSFGQYLGLRHWHAEMARKRSLCGGDRDCIAATYRAQGRFLDRLQRCISSSLARRTCLRDLLASEPETMRR